MSQRPPSRRVRSACQLRSAACPSGGPYQSAVRFAAPRFHAVFTSVVPVMVGWAGLLDLSAVWTAVMPGWVGPPSCASAARFRWLPPVPLGGGRCAPPGSGVNVGPRSLSWLLASNAPATAARCCQSPPCAHQAGGRFDGKASEVQMLRCLIQLDSVQIGGQGFNRDGNPVKSRCRT